MSAPFNSGSISKICYWVLFHFVRVEKRKDPETAEATMEDLETIFPCTKWKRSRYFKRPGMPAGRILNGRTGDMDQDPFSDVLPF